MKQKKIFKKIIYFITFILTIIYIIYRLLFTLPLHLGPLCITLSIIVILTEIWETIDFFIYYFNILKVKKNCPEVPNIQNITEYPDIDIFIATLNENKNLLQDTILACKNLNYPEKNKLHIYLCDDGNKAIIKNLANEMNINYINRISHKDAKAGNYNHALKCTSSPYLVFFDADMAPTPDFLEITLPFFLKQPSKIGFIQLPQSFKNPDIFQYRFNLGNKIPFEQEYFYNSLQISKNVTNSTVFCGTNVMVSRQALQDINGFATDTISEDIATGMLIENKGYTCMALNKIAAYGTSVDDFTGFFKQRSRWARGCIQMSKKYKIFSCNGLSLKQKFEYFSCVSYWYFGIRRLIYLITPLLFSLFGIIIVDCNLMTFLAFWLPPYLLKRFAIDKLENSERSSTWTTIYETILAPVLAISALKELLGFSKKDFDVSPKSSSCKHMSKLNLQVLIFHLILLILNICGFVVSLLNLHAHGPLVYLLPFIWTLSNTFYLFIATIFDFRYKQHDYSDFKPNNTKYYSNFSAFKIFKH